MARKPPGYATQKNNINQAFKEGKITRQERDFLVQDLNIFASDGRLSQDEKRSIANEIGVSQGAPSIKKPPAPPGSPIPYPMPTIRPDPPPSPAPAPAPAPAPPPEMPAAPPPIPVNVWDTNATFVAPTGIKQASPDIIVFDDPVDPEFLTQAFFQEFGGTELINISRSDLINGDEVSYSPIINLSSIRKNFNPNNIIAVGAFQENPTKYGIDLFARGVIEPYFDANGNLVIEIDQIRSDESIEVEIAFDGTINRVEL